MEAGDYQLVIIDSIQTMAVEALTGSPGTVGQITASAQAITGHGQTPQCRHAHHWPCHQRRQHRRAQDSRAPGRRRAVPGGERYGAFKALRGIKNRFGSTSEVGIFEMGEQGLARCPTRPKRC
jgi:DNA repair protein RadA/Sms